MVMTQQYLIGEVVLLLSRLRAEADTAVAQRELDRLCAEAESRPPQRLGPVLVLAAALADGLCWDALGIGDAHGFERRAQLAADVHTFGVCSGLVRGAW
jgi:hypothetical protein